MYLVRGLDLTCLGDPMARTFLLESVLVKQARDIRWEQTLCSARLRGRVNVEIRISHERLYRGLDGVQEEVNGI